MRSRIAHVRWPNCAHGASSALVVETSLALYVHWPWCKAKCPYCDFNAHVWDDVPHDAYVAHLQADIKYLAELVGRKRLVSIFFGGGTPSLMGGQAIGRIIQTATSTFDISASPEITVECNPTSSSAELFQDLKSVGVNRISVGIQGLHEEWLAFLGRKHSLKKALATLDNAQNTFDNVNADLIFGLPKQDLARWLSQLQQLSNRGLSHLSCYQLTIEPQTHFFKDVKEGKWAPLDNDTQADFMQQTCALLATQGYDNYEVSNYARGGLRCTHNQHVWQYGDYAGVGAGAHGRLTLADGRVATQVTKHPRNYLKGAFANERMKLTPLTLEETWTEALLNGLRLDEGVDLADLEERLGGHWPSQINGRAIGLLSGLQLLRHTGNHLSVLPAGKLVLDSLLEQLLRRL